MRTFVTLQHSRYRVSAINRVSELVISQGSETFGFYVTIAHGVQPDWVGYDDEATAIATLDDLHKLLDES